METSERPEYLPYLSEYAKSGRSSCKGCKANIPQASLRLAVVFQSAKFDGKMTSWYHFDCFFLKQRPKGVGDVENFDQLRWEDQEKIKTKIESLGGAGAVEEPKKGRGKGSKSGKSAGGKKLLDFSIQYAKSCRAACRGCLEKILKDEIRISKKSYDGENAMKYGPQDLWHHVNCFIEKREELEMFESIDTVPGFDTLSAEDKETLLKQIPALARKHKLEDAVDGSAVKKIKKEDKEEAKIQEEIKKQNKILYKYKDLLEKELTKGQMNTLLEYNKQEIPSGKSNALDLLCDIMTFGSLKPCTECGTGQFVYRSGVGYECTGDMSEWTKCPNKTKTPDRKEFKVPKEFCVEFSFLNKYKYVPRQRVIPTLLPTPTPVKVSEESVKVKTEPTESGAKASGGPALKGMSFYLDSDLERPKVEIKDVIEKLGGRITSRISDKVAAVLSSKRKIDGLDSTMEKAEAKGIQVVPLDILDEFQADPSNAVFLIAKKNIAPWGTDIEKRLGINGSSKSGSKSGAKGSSGASKSGGDKLKLKLKGGGVVDPDSGLEDQAHVLKSRDALYSVVLGVVDIQHDRNSYYKLQILEHDKKSRWFVFRSWGRVGTKIGDNKLEKMYSKEEAIDQFVSIYEEKTGNAWKNRHNFVKHPKKLYPLDIDYGDASETASKISSANSKSKLPKSVQDLVCMLFDVETMKRTMIEFELDLTKMPLGKLSRKQLEKAYGLLGQAQKLLDSSAEEQQPHQSKFVDVSNQFYTLIPHDFGLKKPDILNDAELIKSKLEMLESLMEIEVAYSLLKAGDQETEKDPIDAHYEKLNTKIEILEQSTEEFKLLQAYVKNTHAATHTQYSLDLEEVYKVVRKGESQRFKPFSKLPNRKLLWHGSRVANMAGILSQGLRIAPPEAPVTGYMFGKGIYFADMVSKSANYCATSKNNPNGLLLLCDVALGNSYERKQADYIEKLKKGYQSVRGVGKTEPNPEKSKKLDGIEIPLGKPITNKAEKSSLLYNEYIVYDVAQVNIKYLLKFKFNYK